MFEKIKTKIENFVFGNTVLFDAKFDKILGDIENNKIIEQIKSEDIINGFEIDKLNLLLEIESKELEINKLAIKLEDVYKRHNDTHSILEKRTSSLLQYKKLLIGTNLIWFGIIIISNYETIKHHLGF